MKKHVTLVLFLAVLILIALPLSFAMADGEFGNGLSWSFDSTTGLLTVSGNGSMEDFTYKRPWDEYKNDIKSVKVEGGVTYIGQYAFSQYDNLQKVELDTGVQIIGHDAFFECSALADVSLPETLTEIRQAAFQKCGALESITIPSSVKKIINHPFSGCSLKTVIMKPSSPPEGFSESDLLDAIVVIVPEKSFDKYSEVGGSKIKPDVCTVTFDSNGGSAVAAEKIKYGEKVAKPDDPTRDGYKLSRWVYSTTYGDYAYDFDMPVENNLTLKAEWEEIVYCTVSFDTCGGTPIPEQQKVVQYEYATKPENDPILSKKVFDHWAKQEGNRFSFWYFDFSPVSSDMTLVAVYRDAYDIIIEKCDHGTVKAKDIQSGNYVDYAPPYTQIELECIPAQGYRLKNVKVTYDTGETIPGSFFLMPEGAVTVTAEFEELIKSEVIVAPEALSLTYSGTAQNLVTSGKAKNGKMAYALGTNTVAPETGWSRTIPTAVDAGTYYVWYKSVGNKNFLDSEPVCLTVTINAVSDVYTVTITNDGHGTAEADPASGVTNTLVKLTVKAAKGYEFKQWKVISGGVTVNDNQFTIGTANVEIQACFKAKTAPPMAYKVIRGANQTVFTNASSAAFASNADFSKFERVVVDGKTVAKKYYKVSSGSTVITFNREFIKTLKTGSHKLTIVSKDGSASTAFNVKDPSPRTGDATSPALLLMLLIVCTGTIALVSAKAKKRN